MEHSTHHAMKRTTDNVRANIQASVKEAGLSVHLQRTEALRIRISNYGFRHFPLKRVVRNGCSRGEGQTLSENRRPEPTFIMDYSTHLLQYKNWDEAQKHEPRPKHKRGAKLHACYHHREVRTSWNLLERRRCSCNCQNPEPPSSATNYHNQRFPIMKTKLACKDQKYEHGSSGTSLHVMQSIGIAKKLSCHCQGQILSSPVIIQPILDRTALQQELLCEGQASEHVLISDRSSGYATYRAGETHQRAMVQGSLSVQDRAWIHQWQLYKSCNVLDSRGAPMQGQRHRPQQGPTGLSSQPIFLQTSL